MLNVKCKMLDVRFRVERFVTSALPHRPVRADFPHTVRLITASLKDTLDRYSYHSILYPFRYLHFPIGKFYL